MSTPFATAALAVLCSAAAPSFQATLESPARIPVAVVHDGDPALTEPLVRVAEVWRDAGEFCSAH